MNTAGHLARLGVPVTLISRVGADDTGRRFKDHCAMSSLSVLWLDDCEQTKLSVVMRTPDGERTLLSVTGGGAGASALPAEVKLRLQQTQMLWVTRADPAERKEIASLCRGLRGLPLQHFDEEVSAGRSWELVVGSIEDAGVPRRTDLERAGVKLCVVTEGSSGGRFSVSGGPWQRFAGVPASQVVDTCGAGDAFLAGLLAGLAHDLSVEQAVESAARCGARAVGELGGWPTTKTGV